MPDFNDNTVFKGSNLGKHLDKVNKGEARTLLFEGAEIPVIDKISIGREKTNDIALPNDKMISRNHALIQKIKEEYFIKDLGSTNGTFVNDEQVPKGKYLKIKNGDKIKVGKTELRMH